MSWPGVKSKSNVYLEVDEKPYASGLSYPHVDNTAAAQFNKVTEYPTANFVSEGGKEEVVTRVVGNALDVTSHVGISAG